MADPGDYNNRVHVRKDKTHTRRLAYLTILLFASPPGWPWFAMGIVLVAAGVMLHGWAAGYLARAGYAEREKILTVRGPYRHNRNPYYLAQMTMDLGFFFLAGRPLLYLFYFPIIFFVYQRWVVNEESFLESEFGESYRTFKREVPRWGFRLKPAPARGSDLRFRWATFMINRELPRSLSHVFFSAAFVLFFFLGNPFSQMSALFRITLIAAIAVWLALRDIYALDVSRKSIGWFLFASCSAAATTLFLIYAPVWQPWYGRGAWVSIGVGLCLGLLVWLATLPGIAGGLGKSSSFFSRPISQWYALTLGLGLFSCTLGGVWLGIMVPFTVWALHLAGAVSIPIVPRRLGVSFALLALIVCSGGLAVARQLS
ncbi:MAG TPA: methyltransferase [Candidatus Binatia bacterium]|nr:methyltransferase [Candidatus Binatia bacterium]